MIGFIRGLFGGRKEQEPQKGAFFLDSDQAKTFGNLDYMRTAKSVRRTYPETTLARVVGSEQTKVVSSDKSMKVDGGQETPKSATFATSQATSFSSVQSTYKPQSSFGRASSTGSSSTSAGDRRRTDSGMDMFRDMAKNLKK